MGPHDNAGAFNELFECVAVARLRAGYLYASTTILGNPVRGSTASHQQLTGGPTTQIWSGQFCSNNNVSASAWWHFKILAIVHFSPAALECLPEGAADVINHTVLDLTHLSATHRDDRVGSLPPCGTQDEAVQLVEDHLPCIWVQLSSPLSFVCSPLLHLISPFSLPCFFPLCSKILVWSFAFRSRMYRILFFTSQFSQFSLWFISALTF